MSEGINSVKKGIKAFIQHVQALEDTEDNNDDNNSFIKEYVQIQEVQMRNQRNNFGSMSVGQTEENLRKNRYKDIVPYDDHRVVLTTLDGDVSSDYINASNIMGVSGASDYIASQGPLYTTVNDFWRMIWEYNIEIVFMACRLIEMKKVKCSQYWSSVGTSQEFGDITVFTESEEDIVTECVRRTLRVTKGEEVHYVVQIQYCGWPDHGIPENPGDIRDIIGMMREMRDNSKAPVLIHCSAGCGRTGAIIAIDYAWTLLEEGKFDETFSLFDLICNFREQRVSLVQTPDQYALVNKVLKSLCEERLIKLASHIYENVQLGEEHPSVENGQEAAEENDYEDIWTLPASSEVKTPVLDPKDLPITDEKLLGRSVESEKNLQTLEQEFGDESPLYVNAAEIHEQLREAVPGNNEQPPKKKTVHTTFIQVDSISTSKEAKLLTKDVTELSADLLTPSESLDTKERDSPTPTVQHNEANLSGNKKGDDITRRGAIKKPAKTASATETTYSSPRAKVATVVSAGKKEPETETTYSSPRAKVATVVSAGKKEPETETTYSSPRAKVATVVSAGKKEPESRRLMPSASVRSHGNPRQPVTAVGLPSSPLQKQQPAADTAIQGFSRRWSSTKSPGATHVPALSQAHNPTTTKSPGATHVPAFSQAHNTMTTKSPVSTHVSAFSQAHNPTTTKSPGATSVSALSQSHNPTTTKSPGATSVSALAQSHNPTTTKSPGATSVPAFSQAHNPTTTKFSGAKHVSALSQSHSSHSAKSRGNVPATSSSFPQRTSSLKYHGTAPTPTSSPHHQMAPVSRTDAHSFPRKSMSVRLNINNKVNDTARLHDNPASIRSENGARGRNSSGRSNDNPTVMSEPSVVSLTPVHVAPTDDKFRGFVRLNSRKQQKPEDNRRH